MPVIGFVALQQDGSYKGRFTTLSIRRSVYLKPNEAARDGEPDFIIWSGDVEIGAAWNRSSATSNNTMVHLAFAAPEFGDRTLHAQLGEAPDPIGDLSYTIIWNPSE